MKSKLLITTFVLTFCLGFVANSQPITVDDVRKEMKRIDLFDGTDDDTISLSNEIQTQRATRVYMAIPNKILDFLEKEQKGVTYSKNVLKGLHDVLSKVNSNDYYHLTYHEKLLTLAQGLVLENKDEVILNKLKAEAKISINLAEILKNRTFAKDYWLHVIQFHPTEALAKFISIYNEPYAMEVLEAIALDAPTVMKEYFGSNHLNFRILKETKNPNVRILIDIHRQFGSTSKSYILINEIIENKLSIAQAHEISRRQETLFQKLLEIRMQPKIYGNYSVEKELEAVCMEKVVEVNLRHDDSEAHRYEPVNSSSAVDLYTYMVYTSEEIFTSSFLGMYERLMSKKTQKSGFEFLKSMNFNRFRIFLKQCAGYNKIDDFLGTMTVAEKEELFKLLCSDLDRTGGDLGPAVDVADFYGSLQRADLKTLLKSTVEKIMIERATSEDLNGMKLYGLLFKLMGGEPETYIWQYEFDLPKLDRVTQAELFTNGKHIQQHFFFDDEDGQTAYNHFLASFGADWKKSDKGNYILLTTGTTKKIEIYIIKPANEIEARDELKRLFDSQRRFPDLIVHRGHSYYIEHTIAGLTNHTKIAILGSCGGYQNISQAMENAMDVQIVSTKQIGTLAINSVLIMETISTIKNGKDVVWPELWKRVRAQVGGNPRFNDYIPPHLNLGARFIKAYNNLSLLE